MSKRNLVTKNKLLLVLLSLALVISTLAGCMSGGNKNQEVIMYTNADQEAVESMKKALDDNGYAGKYILQSFGSSELGGKMFAEGKTLEADLLAMSSFYIESAQEQHDMFADLTFQTGALGKYPAYYTPILGNTGAIFVNTTMLEEKGLDYPTSIKDLTDPKYAGLISIPDIMHSTTAWLLVQSIINEYGTEEGAEVARKLVENCGPHIESSGSGPIKKVRAGEVAIGYGLRHQAVADKQAGMPIDFIDPTEGNFSLTESVAVLKRDDKVKEQMAMDMAEVIIKHARADLITYYPVSLYEGETVSGDNVPKYDTVFNLPLTVDLLEEHRQFFDAVR